MESLAGERVSIEVGDCHSNEEWIVLELANAKITIRAKKPSVLLGSMAMVNAE